MDYQHGWLPSISDLSDRTIGTTVRGRPHIKSGLRSWESSSFCIKYSDTEPLLFCVNQLQIPDTLREWNKSVPDTRYTIHLQGMWHKNARSAKKSFNKSYFIYLRVHFFK